MAEPDATVAEEVPGSTPAEASNEEVAVPVPGEPEEAPREEDAIWVTRCWFLRLPKPPETEGTLHLDTTVESYKTQIRLLNESAAVVRLERDAARKSAAAAWADLEKCKAQVAEKDAVLKPLRDQRDQRKAATKDVKGSSADLEVRSEEELDRRLKDLKFRQEHETLTIPEEKKLLKDMKKLEGQREKVKEYAAKASSLGAVKEVSSKAVAEIKELERERDIVYQERQLQGKIYERYKKEADALNAKVDEILEERNHIKELQDDAFKELRGKRQGNRSKGDKYYANRRFGQGVRQKAAAGLVDEARDMCAKQIDAELAKLCAEDEWREEYVALWEQQRKRPRSEFEDESVTAAPPVNGKKERLENGVVGLKAATATAASKAEQTIAKALESAKQQVMQAASKAEAAINAPFLDAPPAPAAAKDEAAGSSSNYAPPAKAPKPKKAKERRKEVVLPVLDNTPFVPPAAVLNSMSEEPSEEEVRARAREHNRAAAEEAAARKERRRQQAARKKERVQQRKEAQPHAPGSDEVKAPETPPAEEDGLKLAPDAEVATAFDKAVKPEALGPKDPPKPAAAKGKPRAAPKVPTQPPPKARMPLGRKKSLTAYVRHNAGSLVAAGVLALAVLGGTSWYLYA